MKMLLLIFVGSFLKLWEAMISECLCCQEWLSREFPPPFQLDTAVRTALHAHLDTEDILVLVQVTHFGRILQMAKPRKIFALTQNLSRCKFLCFL